MTERKPITIVNHVSIDIARSPERVWAAILTDYVEARKFSGTMGYAVEALDEPTAYLGGYRLRFIKDGTVLDERICRITELAPSSLRLSMMADYLSVPGGMTVHASYRALADGENARFAINCFSSLGIELPGDGSRAAVAETVARMTAQYEAALLDYLQSFKAALEAQA